MHSGSTTRIWVLGNYIDLSETGRYALVVLKIAVSGPDSKNLNGCLCDILHQGNGVCSAVFEHKVILHQLYRPKGTQHRLVRFRVERIYVHTSSVQKDIYQAMCVISFINNELTLTIELRMSIFICTDILDSFKQQVICGINDHMLY